MKVGSQLLPTHAQPDALALESLTNCEICWKFFFSLTQKKRKNTLPLDVRRCELWLHKERKKSRDSRVFPIKKIPFRGTESGERHNKKVLEGFPRRRLAQEKRFSPQVAFATSCSRAPESLCKRVENCRFLCERKLLSHPKDLVAERRKKLK